MPRAAPPHAARSVRPGAGRGCKECVRSAGIGLVGLLLAAAPARAGERRSARAFPIATPPVIDGRLDDPCWSAIEPIGELRQMSPLVDADPTEKTEVRIGFDAEHVYLCIRCFDAEPDRIIATQMSRDAELNPDDRVEIVIDTFHDRRNAFYFQMSAAGSMGDALMSRNGSDYNKPWDGIWEGRTTIDELGWTAEIALPTKTLAFDPGGDTWGFNINRVVKRKLESMRWAAHGRDQSFFRASDAGDVAGFTGLSQGIGLDVVPFFAAHWENERADGEKTARGEPGLDVFYRITPSLQASLTFNTDFAETEVDGRQINLTRFPLFFPEKRDFFLQDAGIFQFADLDSRLVPFFSRRIGRDAAGREVPIEVGGKLTGRAGDWNIGLLDVQTDDTDTLDGENLLVARLSRNVGEQSTIGGIFTNGDPTSQGTARLFGLDGTWRTGSFRGDKALVASAWALKSDNEKARGDDLALGASLAYPNDLWSWRTSAREIQQDFDPRLGFVPRTGIRSYDARLGFEPRLNGAVRSLEFSADLDVVTDLQDRAETVEVGLQPLGIVWDSGEEARLSLTKTRERLDEAFEIQDGVTIPSGEYDFTRARVEVETSQVRPLSGEVSASAGEFFDGTRFDLGAEAQWRPSRYFTGTLAWERSAVDLEGGDFVTHLGSLRADVSFSTTLLWSSFVQFDNESDSLGVFSRVRWILAPGRELFLVFNETVERRSGSLVPLEQQAALKLVYTLRF